VLQAEIENRKAGHEHEPDEDDTTKSDTAKAAAPHTHPPGTPPHSH
jgi:hypothetical protein